MIAWLYTHKKKWRRWILLLMLVSIVGPWIYETIYVPPPNPCSSGFRVNENFCGSPLSGMWVFFTVLASVSSITSRFFTGEASAGEFLLSVGTILYILLPVVSLLLVAGKADPSPQKVKLHHGILIFASMLGVLGVLIVMNDISFILKMWGFWTYSLLVFISLALELLSLLITRRQNAVNQNMIV
jgi:predicted ferric reductase